MNQNLLKALIVLLIISCSSTTNNLSQAPSDLEKIVDEACSTAFEFIGPGTAIAVVKDGEIILNKSYGYANLENELPIDANSRFDLASVSKQFAGYAIATLVEQGKIRLEDDIRGYIPELNDFGPTITIDHLVHHTSGVRDWTSTLPLSGRTFDDVISFDHILRMAFQQKALNFEPGDQYVYSNTGYNLLAELVQRVSGMSFREWTDKNIFQPLGMTESLFLDDHKEVIPNRVTGYRSLDNGQFEATPNLLTAFGSSSMYSTTTDLSKWTTHLIDGINSGDPVITRMITKGVLNNGEENTYAYGLGVSDYRGTPWISHSGSWASFTTYVALLPEHNLSVVVLNNFQRNGSNIAREVAAYYVPETGNEEEEQPKNEPVSVETSLLDDYVGMYRLGPTWYVNITRNEDELVTQATNESSTLMVALSDTSFVIPGYSNRTMTFYRNEKGEVSHLVYMDEERPKMKDSFEYDPGMNNQFLGEYYSEELNTYFSIVEKDGELRLNHFDHGEISLTPVWTDDFSGGMWWIGSVVFERDEQGMVIGFYTSNYRARNQWFRKL